MWFVTIIILLRQCWFKFIPIVTFFVFYKVMVYLSQWSQNHSQNLVPCSSACNYYQTPGSGVENHQADSWTLCHGRSKIASPTGSFLSCRTCIIINTEFTGLAWRNKGDSVCQGVLWGGTLMDSHRPHSATYTVWDPGQDLAFLSSSPVGRALNCWTFKTPCFWRVSNSVTSGSFYISSCTSLWSDSGIFG